MTWKLDEKTEFTGSWKMVRGEVHLTPDNPMIFSFWKTMFPEATTDSSLTLPYDRSTDTLKLQAPAHDKESEPWIFRRKK